MHTYRVIGRKYVVHHHIARQVVHAINRIFRLKMRSFLLLCSLLGPWCIDWKLCHDECRLCSVCCIRLLAAPPFSNHQPQPILRQRTTNLRPIVDRWVRILIKQSKQHCSLLTGATGDFFYYKHTYTAHCMSYYRDEWRHSYNKYTQWVELCIK